MDVVITDFNNSPLHKKALFCAKLCELAYHIDVNPEMKKELGINKYLIQKIANLKYKSIQYHVYESKTHQFLVIRGTDTKFGILEALSDLLVSINILPKRHSSGFYTHYGYSDVGNKIIDQLCKKHILDKNKKLIITGHSLGGAIAKYISTHVEREIELFTFGAPQVTENDYYVFKHDIMEAHYSNPCDWICSYPSTIYNDQKYVYHLKPSYDIELKKIKRLGLFVPFTMMSLRMLIGNKKLFNDHAIVTYIHNLEKYLEK